MGKYDIGLSGSSAATASNSSAFDVRGGGGVQYGYGPPPSAVTSSPKFLPWIVGGVVALAGIVTLFLFLRN